MSHAAKATNWNLYLLAFSKKAISLNCPISQNPNAPRESKKSSCFMLEKTQIFLLSYYAIKASHLAHIMPTAYSSSNKKSPKTRFTHLSKPSKMSKLFSLSPTLHNENLSCIFIILPCPMHSQVRQIFKVSLRI